MYRGASGFDEQLAQAWPPLGYLGYVLCWPSMLQLVIRTLYRSLECQLARACQPGGPLAGLDVVAFPLFEVLDGTNPSDYNQRVEPSVQGGEKMARAFLKLLGHKIDGGGGDGGGGSASGRPNRSPRSRRGVHERSISELSNGSTVLTRVGPRR